MNTATCSYNCDVGIGNNKVMDSLQPLIAECKEKKYRLAIFESGEQDLVENTKDLLIHNRGLEKTDDTPKVMGLG